MFYFFSRVIYFVGPSDHRKSLQEGYCLVSFEVKKCRDAAGCAGMRREPVGFSESPMDGLIIRWLSLEIGLFYPLIPGRSGSCLSKWLNQWPPWHGVWPCLTQCFVGHLGEPWWWPTSSTWPLEKGGWNILITEVVHSWWISWNYDSLTCCKVNLQETFPMLKPD